MSCPLFKDYARECVIKFEELVNIASFDFCKSDRYKECPMYKAIVEKVPLCEFLDLCASQIKYGNVDFEKIIILANSYCQSDNKVKCAIYKLRKADKDVPNDLLADGGRVSKRLKNRSKKSFNP